MSPIDRFVTACSAREDGTSQALFRIAIGLCVVWILLDVWAAGLVQVLWIDRAHGGMRTLTQLPWLLAWWGEASPVAIHGLFALGLAGGVGLILGVGGRLTAALTLVSVGSLVDVNSHAGGSYDELLQNALWLLVLAGGHQTLSLQARWRSGRWWPEASVWAVPRWLALWQLCLMYGTTGMQKVSVYWVPGGESSALYYILQQPTWQRMDMTWLASVYPLTQVATMVTWWWEVLAFVWFLTIWFAATPDRPGRWRAWSNRLQLRWVFAGMGLVMHALIFATMEVGPFSPLSLSFYLLLAQPAEWRAALSAGLQRLQTNRPQPSR